MTLGIKATGGMRWTALSSICTTSTEVVRMIVLAHYLSPTDFGLMGMVYVVIGLAQTYADLGISAAIIHRQDVTDNQLSSLYWLNIFSGLMAFVAIWVCTPFVTFFFKESRLTPLLHVVAIVFVVTAIGQQFELLLQKELIFKTLATIEITTAILSLVVAVVLALAGFGVWVLVYSFLVTTFAKTLLLVLCGLPHHKPVLHFRRSDLKGFVSFGLFQMGERSINYISERLDQILIGSLLGVEALGFYNFAFNLTARPIWRLNPIVTRVAFPLFAKVQNDLGKLRRGYLKVIGLLTMVNAPILIGMAAVAPMAVPLFFGQKWNPSVILIQITSFVCLFRTIGNPIGSLQLAKGRADLGFYWNLALFAGSIPAVYFGAKLGHAAGVAWGLLTLQVVLSVPVYLYFVRPLVGPCGSEYAAAIVKPVGIACIMGSIVVALSTVLRGPARPLELILQIALGGTVYLLLIRIIHREAFREFRRALLVS